MAKNSNRILNPNARDAMDRFKMEAAGEVGVSLKNGYNGDISAKQAGSIGGQMVKNVTTARLTNGAKSCTYERENRIVNGHKVTVRYVGGLAV